jgi:hypothetical protein
MTVVYLEMTGVYLNGSSRPTPPPQSLPLQAPTSSCPSRPTQGFPENLAIFWDRAPSPSSYQGEGHLAVGVLADGAFAASTVPIIAYLSGRCIAVCKDRCTDVRKDVRMR